MEEKPQTPPTAETHETVVNENAVPAPQPPPDDDTKFPAKVRRVRPSKGPLDQSRDPV